MAATDGRALTWSNAAGTWPDLTGAAVTLTAHRNGARRLEFAGAVDNPTGNQQISFQPSAADLPQPLDAAPDWIYQYAITARLTNGHPITLETGRRPLRRGR